MVDSTLTMFTTFTFDTTKDLFDFLNYHSTIGTWEVQLVRLVAIGGMTMDLNTKRTDYKGNTKYLTFNNVKTIINTFLEDNSYLNISTEIKLRYPDIQRHIMDKNDEYEVFWLNCYSDPTKVNGEQAYISISFLETTKNLSVDPLTSWAVYIHSLYNDFIKSKKS